MHTSDYMGPREYRGWQTPLAFQLIRYSAALPLLAIHMFGTNEVNARLDANIPGGGCTLGILSIPMANGPCTEIGEMVTYENEAILRGPPRAMRHIRSICTRSTNGLGLLRVGFSVG